MLSKCISLLSKKRLQEFSRAIQKQARKEALSQRIQEEVGFKYDVTPAKSVIFDYENQQKSIIEDKSQKVLFKVAPNTKTQNTMLRKEFQDYKKRSLQEPKIKSIEQIDVPQLEIDDLWQNDEPSKRIYEKVMIKEMYWFPRSAQNISNNQRKIAYLTYFSSQTNLNSHVGEILNTIKIEARAIIDNHSPQQQPEDCFKSDEKINILFQQLKQYVQNAHISEFLDIGVELNLIRYKKDVFGIWKIICERIQEVLHSFKMSDLIKLYWVLDSKKPKIGTPELHKKIRDLINEDFSLCSNEDLLHLMHAYRLSSKDYFFSQCLKELHQRKSQITCPKNMVNLVYTYANCRPNKHNLPILRSQDLIHNQVHNLIETFGIPVLDSLQSLDMDTLVRFLLSFVIARIPGYNEVTFRSEKIILASIHSLDSFQLSNIMYAYSKFDNGRAQGSKELYQALQKRAENLWENLSNKQKSQIYYAFINRGVLVESFYSKYILPWIKKQLNEFDQDVLSNVAFGLMTQKVKDKDLWRLIIQTICKHPLRVPIHYLQIMKFVKQYVSSLWNWNFEEFDSACFHAEQYYSIARQRSHFDDKENIDSIRFFVNDLKARVNTWYEHNNTFVIEMAVLPEKVAILVMKQSDTNLEGEMGALMSIKQSILVQQGWEVILYDCQKNQKIPFQTQIDIYQKQLQEACNKMKSKYDSQEQERINSELDNLQRLRLEMLTYHDINKIKMEENLKKKGKPSQDQELEQLDTIIKFK